MRQWQVQDVKARFDEVLKIAQHEGPQEVTSNGRSLVVVLSRERYDKLTGNDRSFVEFMASSPLRAADDLSFDRDLVLD